MFWNLLSLMLVEVCGFINCYLFSCCLHLFIFYHVLPTGQPVGIYSAPLKQVVQKLPSASSSDYAKFELTLGDLMTTKVVVRTDIQGCRLVICFFWNRVHK